jgi:hypothetical protein
VVDQWWYRRFGEEFGPVAFERLEELARTGNLDDTDQIRQGPHADWVTGNSIPGLFLSASSGIETDSTSESESRETPAPSERRPADASTAALDILSHLSRGRPRQADDQGGQRRSLNFEAAANVFSDDARQSEASPEASTQRTPAVKLNLSTLRAVAGWSLATAVVVAIPLVVLPQFGRSESAFANETYALYSTIWQELKDLRANSAGEPDWQKFSDRVRGQVAPSVQRLERTADARHHELQCLLWAGRDCLPRMLADARVEPSASEQEFKEHLIVAAAIIHGEEPAAGRRLPGKQPAGGQRIGTRLHLWLMVFLIVVDAGIVVVAIGVLRKRLR